jgi:tRNA 2-thiouridine synthesizing protein A
VTQVIVTTVDALGQSCPGPLVSLHQALRGVPSGSLLELLATDPGARSDVPSWAQLSGNELVDREERDGVLRFVIRKA